MVFENYRESVTEHQLNNNQTQAERQSDTSRTTIGLKLNGNRTRAERQ